jgi:major vault protein
MSESVIRIKPNFYVHVLDNNTNVTRVITGPHTFTRKDHEKVVAGPEPMITVPPRHYCRIANPIVRDAKGNPVTDTVGQIKIRHGDEEIRFSQEPFALFPGETLKEKPQALAVVNVNQALKLKALRDFTGEKGVSRVAGDEWLFIGPGTYIPRIEESVVEKVPSIIVKENEALKIKAKMDCVDWNGKKRVAGEQWLVTISGAYLPNVCEEVLGTVKAIVLTPSTAIHLLATNTHVDIFKRKHRAGEEWLVTMSDCETYIADIDQTVKGIVKITTLTNREFCVVLDPIGSDGRNRLGKRELRKGECSFFLHPGERLEKGIQPVFILADGEALLLCARELVNIGDQIRKPGDRWMIYGPCDFIPSVEVDVVERRNMIPLDENEGIYVRDIITGKISAIIGRSYMLKPNEDLWAKPLSPEVESLLTKEASRDKKDKGEGKHRDPTRVVSYRVPHGAAVQVYNYESKSSRVVFGPDLVLLQPDEHFTTLNLSGDIPKKASQIQTIALFLGPDFMTDQITVETADHARLSLKLSYNWYFDVDPDKPETAHTVFSTPDFVGDLTKALGARVRGVVAGTTFDQFHKHSVEIIQEAVFGRNSKGEMNDKLLFNTNNLVVTNIDIQSVEPVDQKTRDSLQKSVQLAIEITTKSQEATARHEAERLEQEAKGRLERQKLADEGAAERARKALLELKAESDAVESAGQATAEAHATAAAAQIEGKAAVERANLEAQSATITAESGLKENKAKQTVQRDHRKKTDDMEVKKQRDLAEIETAKFVKIVDAIGADTIRAIAQAGPEMQSKLLGSLGLKSVMITDGNSPINLFSTAGGLVGSAAPPHP